MPFDSSAADDDSLFVNNFCILDMRFGTMIIIPIMMNGNNSNTEPVIVFTLDDSDDCGMINEDARIDVIDAITNGCSMDKERLRRALFNMSI